MQTCCLLDKVVSRYAVSGLIKLRKGKSPVEAEIYSMNLIKNAGSRIKLFIPLASANILIQYIETSKYKKIIKLFLTKVEIAFPTRYFRRWSRRLRDFGFTREDAAVIALATFGTNESKNILGTKFVATLDQPMINNWTARQTEIKDRYNAMQADLSYPYNQALLPQVMRPDEISILTGETP